MARACDLTVLKFSIRVSIPIVCSPLRRHRRRRLSMAAYLRLHPLSHEVAIRPRAGSHPNDRSMVQVPTVPPSERYPGRPGGGRLVVIAPTRAACETIEMGVGLTGIETVREARPGEGVGRRAAGGRGVGIVAGTGTGQTLAIRPIAEEIVGTPLRTGVENREGEATPETPSWNVVIVTTGIAS